MRLTPLRRSGLLASAAMAAVATLALATTSLAEQDAPVSGDPRATAYLKNVDIKHPEACTVGGLTGVTIHPDLFDYSGGDNQLHLNITGLSRLPEGMKVTGIVVKGGPVFNVYLADKLGATLPWEKLRAPLKDNGNGSDISHWYGCGIKDTTTTPTTTTTTTTTTTVTQSSTPSSSSGTTTTTTGASSSDVAPTTTTTAAVVPVANEDDLAATGFGSAWMLGLGAALVAAGAALVLVMRRRRI
ncbi:LPXTG-motif cell wall anchor domain-containing protein [Lentzea albidocapillata subsp. violacea]|uniref:LPXTG-motif cell wall anchor domain-containing protein n=1 Tax=Lentzea albidocapillata subsp. violacea TaxID=128104 RepID=A0A1G9J680_9PSEU|nr:LPXTG cell wall anchor domain-containing protein [Lentzea albidocapillata]SDL33020.1 LPXTG-motif cell wall anchor domain-containing protein [Lentzea albidocapillata subsp. violacea]